VCGKGTRRENGEKEINVLLPPESQVPHPIVSDRSDDKGGVNEF